jgi:hypothetical protein
VIAAQHQRDLSFIGGALDHFRQARAGVRDLRKIPRMRGTRRKAFRLVHDYVPQIFGLVAEFSEFLIQAGDAQGRRTHVHAAASRAQIHGRADDGDMRLTHAGEKPITIIAF